MFRGSGFAVSSNLGPVRTNTASAVITWQRVYHSLQSAPCTKEDDRLKCLSSGSPYLLLELGCDDALGGELGAKPLLHVPACWRRQ